MNEKRYRSRRQVDMPIQVIDCNTLETLGMLANISTNGFMLISEQRIDPNRIYQLRLEFTQPIDGIDAIECGAESLWSDSAEDDPACWNGFHIIDISTADASFITNMFALTED